jgi:inorganic pyrophosphatase
MAAHDRLPGDETSTARPCPAPSGWSSIVPSAVPPRDPESGLFHVVIDTPRGSRNKYKLDQRLGCFVLSRILPRGMAFPYDFGSVPDTRGEDGDPVDVMVIADEPSFVGCVMTVRLIGVIEARQLQGRKWIRNDRLIAVPQTPVNLPMLGALTDLRAGQIADIERFFVVYNAAHGRRFEPLRRAGPRAAVRLLRAAMRRTDRPGRGT